MATRLEPGVPGGTGDRRMRKLRFMYAPCVDFVIREGGTEPIVLDVGTGSGIILEHVRDRGAGARLVGLDLRMEPMRLSDSRGICYVQGDAKQIPLAADSVDVVVCRSSFRYYDDHERVLSEIVRVLKPGGSAYITDPIPGRFRRWAMIILGVAVLRRPYDEMAEFVDGSLSRREILDLLRRAGITEYEYGRMFFGTYFSLIIRKRADH